MSFNIEEIKDSIRDIKDFPKKGIVFKDITTLLNNPEVFNNLMQSLKKRYENENIDYIVGLDARGFIFGSALAVLLGVGFVPIRKKGKLPCDVYSKEYDLEYGKDTLQLHKDAFKNKNARVIMIDDLLATGGTAMAAIDLIEQAGASIVESCFILYLEFLKSKPLIQSKSKVFTIINIE